MGDGSKLTLVPTVEAGLMVNGWGTVPQRLWRRRAAPSPESLVPSTHPARAAPAGKQLPALVPGPSWSGAPAQSGISSVSVPGLEARAVCDAGPGEPDRDTGKTRAGPSETRGRAWEWG